MPTKAKKALKHRAVYAQELTEDDSEFVLEIQKEILINLKGWLKQDWLHNIVYDGVWMHILDAIGRGPLDEVSKTTRSRINATTELLVRQIQTWVLEGVKNELTFGNLDVIEKETPKKT